MNKKILIPLIILILIITILLIYPNISFQKNNKLYYFSYNEVESEFEENMCYDESYSYNKKRDISIYDWNTKNFLFFYLHTMSYKEGNVCDREFVLTEQDLNRIITEAEIIDNEDNIDISKLIKDKEPIVSNTRYPWNDKYLYIGYELDGNYKEMYISYNEDDLLIIQVGNSDEGPRYIAYK